MKIGEKAYEDDGKLIIQKTHDFNPVLKQMEQIRSAGIKNMGDGPDNAENRFVGRIPLALIEQWCKEAGIKWDDTHARAEVVKRKILSGEFDKFRSDWKGSY